MEDFTSSPAFRVAGTPALAKGGITRKDVDHQMIDEAPWSLSEASVAHLPIQGLEDLVSGTARAGRLRTCDEAGAFICRAQHRPRRQITLDTNGGGLSYMHSGMYGRNAL
jgi:hypothetical protein